MALTAGTLVLDTKVDLSGITGAIDKVQSQFGALGKSMDSAFDKMRGQKFDVDTAPAENKFASLAGTVGKVGIATAITGTTAAIGGLTVALGKSVSAAADFETQMSAIKAVSGASAQDMDLLSKKALQLGKDTSYSASEAADAIGELIKAGVSVPDVLNGAADAAVNLAAAGGVSIPEAATLASNAMNAFNISAKDMNHTVDTIAGVANASAIDVGEFAFSLQSVGAVAHTVGLSFDDTAAAIGLMGNAGIKGSDAGTSLKTMLMGLQPQTKKQTALFKDLGLMTEDGANAFFDAQGNIKSMADIAGTLQKALGGMTKQQQLSTLETLFGTDAVRAASVIMNEGTQGVEDFTKAMTGISAADVAATRMDNLSGRMEQFKGSIETLEITVGMALLPVLSKLVDAVTAVVNAMIPIAERYGPMIAAAFGSIGDALMPIIDSIMPALNDAFASGDVEGFATTLSTDLEPTISALVPMFKQLGETVVEVVTWFMTDGQPMIQDFADEFLRVANTVIPIFANAITSILAEIGPTLQAISDLWAKYGDTIMSYTERIWNEISRAVKDVVTIIQNAIELFLNIIQGDWSGAWDNIKAILGAVLDLIVNEISTVLDLWRDMFTSFFSWILDQAQKAWDAVKDAIAAVLGAITTTIESALSAMQTALSTAWSAIQSAVQTAWDNVSSRISDAWNTIKTNVASAVADVRDGIDRVFTDAQNRVQAIWNTISQTISDKWTEIKNTLTNVGAAIQSALTDPFQRASDALGGIMSAIGNAIKSPWNNAASAINSFLSGFAHAVDWVGDKLKIGSLIGSPPSIPTFATGGVSEGGPAIVGERGPEMVILPKGAEIIDAARTRQILDNPSDVARIPADLMVDIFKLYYGEPPQGAPIGAKGVGAGPFDAVVSKVKDLTGDAADAVREFVGQGVEKVVELAFSQFNVAAPLGDSFLAPVGKALFSTMKDALVNGLKGVWGDVTSAVAEVTGGVTMGEGGEVTGGDDIMSIAFRTPGQYMWCEKFVGDVMARAGRQYYRAESAEQHAHMQPLASGLGPRGAVVFFPWEQWGHVAFSGGDGRYFGTVPSGTGWSSGMRPYGWTANPRAGGGLIDEPVFGIGLNSGETWSFGERGPEWVTPLGDGSGGGATSLTVNIAVTPLPGQDAESVGAATGRGFL